ncbi:MAG: B12-binding domain-containing radical SAM protein [Acidobacteria bacterium]|nr:MAG: B12-binding domain-containing radical SAM protein [Acidobacteriota bacterium]
MRKHHIVLYNPRAPFFTMPLALIAVGSALDRSRYEVTLVDGRLEPDPVARVLDATDGALCLGVSVLTGIPIRDALGVTRAVRARHPRCRIVWGGWHPSLFPRETLNEAGVDAVVVGQGEEAFADLVERFAAGRTGQDGRDGQEGEDGENGRDATGVIARRPARDINDFPEHDYGLIAVERYFALKRERQLDYTTSQGCRFRCTFCADPTVYGRAWSGLEPARVATELDRLWHRHHFTDVGFQDETFFTHANRVGAIAEEILGRDLHFTWMATMRGDQGARLDEHVLLACRHAGLRRVMIGLESGSQQMLDWMKKDLKVEQVFVTAEKCRRHGIAVLCNLIVGFPDEPPESVAATLDAAKALRALGPDFQVALFYYRPYPGTPITDALARRGHPLPRSLDEWAAIEESTSHSPWVDAGKRALIDRFSFYQRIGWARPDAWRVPLQAIARWRCRRDVYAFPIEKTIVEWVRQVRA